MVNNPTKETVPRDSRTVEGRMRFIQAYDEFVKLIPDLTVSTFASHVDFKYPKSTATRIWRDREGIIACVENNPGRRTLSKIYPRKMETVEQAVYYAILEERSLGM